MSHDGDNAVPVRFYIIPEEKLDFWFDDGSGIGKASESLTRAEVPKYHIMQQGSDISFSVMGSPFKGRSHFLTR
jgi:hypothetical protein